MPATQEEWVKNKLAWGEVRYHEGADLAGVILLAERDHNRSRRMPGPEPRLGFTPAQALNSCDPARAHVAEGFQVAANPVIVEIDRDFIVEGKPHKSLFRARLSSRGDLPPAGPKPGGPQRAHDLESGSRRERCFRDLLVSDGAALGRPPSFISRAASDEDQQRSRKTNRGKQTFHCADV
jgi:hypothetical protein